MFLENADCRTVAAMNTSTPMGGNRIHSDGGARHPRLSWRQLATGRVGGHSLTFASEAGTPRRRTQGARGRDRAGQFRVDYAQPEGEVCLVGMLGLGPAPWLGELVVPQRLQPESRPTERSALSLETAPVDQDLRPYISPVAEDAWLRYARGTIFLQVARKEVGSCRTSACMTCAIRMRPSTPRKAPIPRSCRRYSTAPTS